MLTQFEYKGSGKVIEPLALSGTIKQIQIDMLDRDGRAGPLLKTRATIRLNGVKIIDNYEGSQSDELPVVTVDYKVNETTKFEVELANAEDESLYLVGTVLITINYIPKDGRYIDFRGGTLSPAKVKRGLR